jgi:phage N-6-adenine-methyltransferase
MPQPKQKPGLSKQDYATPREFIDAVERRFGAITLDLAASPDNAKAKRYFTIGQDSLSQDWGKLLGEGHNLWLNPPFRNIVIWAKKCSETKRPYVRPDEWPSKIMLLTPASVSTNWFRDYVFGKARVFALNPRMSFDGEAVFPKDLLLSVYGLRPGFEVWRWK